MSNVRCPPYDVHHTMSKVKCPRYDFHRTMSTVRCPPCEVQRTMSAVRCPPYNVQGTMSNVRRPMYGVQPTISSELVSLACTAKRPAVRKHSGNSLHLCGCPPACLASLRAGKQPKLGKSVKGQASQKPVVRCKAVLSAPLLLGKWFERLS